MTGFLGKEDLRQLTGAARQGDQVDWLRSEGVPFKLNRKDELVVSWSHVHAWLEGRPTVSLVAPDFSKLRALRA